MNTPSPAASMLYSGQWRFTEPTNPSSGTAGMAAGRDGAGSAPTLDLSTGAASRLVVLGIPMRFLGCADVTALQQDSEKFSLEHLPRQSNPTPRVGLTLGARSETSPVHPCILERAAQCAGRCAPLRTARSGSGQRDVAPSFSAQGGAAAAAGSLLSGVPGDARATCRRRRRSTATIGSRLTGGLA